MSSKYIFRWLCVVGRQKLMMIWLQLGWAGLAGCCGCGPVLLYPVTKQWHTLPVHTVHHYTPAHTVRTSAYTCTYCSVQWLHPRLLTVAVLLPPPHLVLYIHNHNYFFPDYNKIIFYLPTLCRILISSSLLTAAEIEVVSINMDLFHYCRMISTLLLKATLTIDNDLVWLPKLLNHLIFNFSITTASSQFVILSMCYLECIWSTQDTPTATF